MLFFIHSRENNSNGTMNLMNTRVLEPESKMVIENSLYLICTIIIRRLGISLVLNIFENIDISQKTYIKGLLRHEL